MKQLKGLKIIIPWLIWGLASLTYFHQYYLRESLSSLSHYLMHDFFLSVLDLSDLAILFFSLISLRCL